MTAMYICCNLWRLLAYHMRMFYDCYVCSNLWKLLEYHMRMFYDCYVCSNLWSLLAYHMRMFYDCYVCSNLGSLLAYHMRMLHVCYVCMRMYVHASPLTIYDAVLVTFYRKKYVFLICSNICVLIRLYELYDAWCAKCNWSIIINNVVWNKLLICYALNLHRSLLSYGWFTKISCTASF